MDGATILIAVIAGVAAAAFVAVWLYRRGTTPAEHTSEGSGAKATVKPWGVRVSAPNEDRACRQVRELFDMRFTMGEQPTLPVPSCPHPQQCECRFVKLLDNRSEVRRGGDERRLKGYRMEEGKEDRRSGNDRRKKERVDWDRR